MAFNKPKALKIVNPAAGILFVVQAASGMGHEAIPYEIFEKLHGLSGFLLTLALVAHIILNWSWFKTAFAKKRTT